MIQSRRDFLKNAGKVAVAASVATVLPMGALAEKVEHPFTWSHLDPEATADRAYASFSSMGGCCIAVADAIIGQLADTVGAPFDGIPVKMFQNGAAACIGLVCEPADSKAILAEVMKWYRESDLPAYDRGEPALAAVVPGSNNCVDSLGKFFAATGITSMSDPGRINRCACLAADTAKKTVELLNAHYGV